MLWIIGSIVMIFLGTVLMCALIAGGRADERKEMIFRMEPPFPLPYSDEEKLRVVLEGFHTQVSVSNLCEREGISPILFDSWVNDLIAAGKTHVTGNSLHNEALNRT
jgi:hypothetical protein